MSFQVSSFLSAGFLASRGIEAPKPLRDWLTRAAYLAKNRGSEKEQQRYVYWALRAIEEAAAAPGGVSSVDWKQFSPVMPPGVSSDARPKLLQNGENGLGANSGAATNASEDARARASVLEETLKRAPTELHPFVSQAFDLYDRDVAAGKRHYYQVSSLEMINLAKNLYSRDLQRRHASVAAAQIAPVAPAPPLYSQTPLSASAVLQNSTPHRPGGLHAPQLQTGQLHQHQIFAAPQGGPPAPNAVSRKRERQHHHDGAGQSAMNAIATSHGKTACGEEEMTFFGALASGRSRANAGSPSAPGEAPSPSGDGFVGHSSDLERRYSRYEPTVDDIRPLSVLHDAFDFIRARAEEKKTAEGPASALKYLNEQLKGLRQDLRVQNINDDFAVSVYEFHARLCLEIGDLGEFNQCQSALKRLYVHPAVVNKAVCGVSEFFAYRVVYLSLCQQFDSLSTELINFTNETLHPLRAGSVARFVHKDDVHHALRLSAACSEGDCASLMRELQCFPDQMGYLVRIYLQRLRVGWLREILRGVRGVLSLRFLMANLGFMPLRQSERDGARREFWLDGSDESAEKEFNELFQTIKVPLPGDFDFRREVIRDTKRDHAGGSRNTAAAVPCLDAAATREMVERYVSFLSSRKDAIGSSSSASP